MMAAEHRDRVGPAAGDSGAAAEEAGERGESGDPFDWSPVRRAMRSRVNATSLRDLARDLGGMSPTGLQHFLDGATPRRKRPLFMEWFLTEGARWREADAVLAAAIEVVVAHASHDRRDELRGYLKDALLMPHV